MDIPRKPPNRRLRRMLIGLAVAAVVALVTVGVSRLKPAAPTLDGATMWPGTVKRGSMLRQVRGLGTLVPEEILWIPALNAGRVKRILVRPGAEVKANTILLELTNPELEQTAVEAEFQLKAAHADYNDLEVRIQTQLLNERASAATVQANYQQAKLRAEADEQLYKEGLISELTLKLSKTTADELATRQEIEQKRLAITSESAQAQLAAQRARVDQLRALYELRRSQVEGLRVPAGIDGVLQQLPLEVGQQVTVGHNLARVAVPGRLKAEVRIAETQAKDIQIGQKAAIDTRNGIIPGRVSRSDPAVQEGTVKVDVTLEGPLPRGARPDLTVDGTIEIERLEDVLYVERPAFGQENSTISLFKMQEDGTADRVQVKLGRSSVNTIEILDGLKVGDRVILSDTSQYDDFDRIRLK